MANKRNIKPQEKHTVTSTALLDLKSTNTFNQKHIQFVDAMNNLKKRAKKLERQINKEREKLISTYPVV